MSKDTGGGGVVQAVRGQTDYERYTWKECLVFGNIMKCVAPYTVPLGPTGGSAKIQSRALVASLKEQIYTILSNLTLHDIINFKVDIIM